MVNCYFICVPRTLKIRPSWDWISTCPSRRRFVAWLLVDDTDSSPVRFSSLKLVTSCPEPLTSFFEDVLYVASAGVAVSELLHVTLLKP